MPQRGSAICFPAQGEYAGSARYLPGDITSLTPLQRSAIGKVLDLFFMGIAPSGPWRGQCMYRESAEHSVIGPTLVPESDLDFIKCAPTTRV